VTLQEGPSDNIERYTPDDALAFVREVFHGPPDLDPCADPRRRAGAKMSFTKKDDGLSRSWGADTVFLNPPYGKPLPEWVRKARKEWCSRLYEPLARGPEYLWLVPARFSTVWMDDLLTAPSVHANVLVCAPRKRYKFLNKDYGPFIDPKTGRESSPKFPNVWVYWCGHERGGRFVECGNRIGKVMEVLT